MKVSKNTQQLQKTEYLGSSVENKVELEGKQRVHREFSATPKGRTNEFEYGSLERILSRENLNFAMQRVISNKGSHGVDCTPQQVDAIIEYFKKMKEEEKLEGKD